MPIELVLLHICERFPGAGAPWDLEQDERGDRIRYYMNVMGLEAQYKGDLEGLGPRDDMDWGDDT